MPEYGDFQELICLARTGDEAAATRLAHEFEPFIRRFVRFRMRYRPNHERLRPEIDSADICQSIFKSLFVGLREGKFELNRPEQLTKLLSAMARFKVATMARRLSVTLREILEVDADAIKADYLEEVESFQAGYRADCIRARIDYVPLHTGMPFDKALMSYLLSRQARG